MSKKSSKQNMVSNMSRSTPIAPDPLDQLVYGTIPQSVPTLEAAPIAARRIVFTNQLTPQVYILLRQYEYWGRKAIHEILDEALTSFLADKPEAQQALPEKEQAKLQGKLAK